MSTKLQQFILSRYNSGMIKSARDLGVGLSLADAGIVSPIQQAAPQLVAAPTAPVAMPQQAYQQGSSIAGTLGTIGGAAIGAGALYAAYKYNQNRKLRQQQELQAKAEADAYNNRGFFDRAAEAVGSIDPNTILSAVNMYRQFANPQMGSGAYYPQQQYY
jgi:hypothetical protein